MSVDITVSERPSLLDVVKVFDDIRQVDKDEWYAGSGSDDFISLTCGAIDHCPYVRMAMINGTPALFWGAYKGNLWLFATNQAVRYSKSLHKALLPEIAKLQAEFGDLEAYSDIRNPVHHRWLEWLGFKKGNTITRPLTNHKFIHYTLKD